MHVLPPKNDLWEWKKHHTYFFHTKEKEFDFHFFFSLPNLLLSKVVPLKSLGEPQNQGSVLAEVGTTSPAFPHLPSSGKSHDSWSCCCHCVASSPSHSTPVQLLLRRQKAKRGTRKKELYQPPLLSDLPLHGSAFSSGSACSCTNNGICSCAEHPGNLLEFLARKLAIVPAVGPCFPPKQHQSTPFSSKFRMSSNWGNYAVLLWATHFLFSSFLLFLSLFEWSAYLISLGTQFLQLLTFMWLLPPPAKVVVPMA